MRLGNGVVLGRPKGFGLPAIGCAQTFLSAGQVVFGVENAPAFEEPEAMFHLHLHRLCEVPENQLPSSRRARRGYAEQWRSTPATRHFPDSFPDSFPDNRGFFASPQGQPPLIFNGLQIGSRGRTRTYNPTVNSRVLYH